MGIGKSAALLAVSGLLAGGVAAQYRSPVLLGVGIGASLSDFQNPDSDSRWGFSGGLFLGKATYRTLTTIEVNYVQKGGDVTGQKTRIDYVEVPLTFGGVGRTRNGAGRARLYGGISAAFKVSCSSDVAAAVCGNAEGVEWAAPFGLMIGRHTENDRFAAIDVRYNIPLSHAFQGGAYNQTWQFRIIVGRPR